MTLMAERDQQRLAQQMVVQDLEQTTAGIGFYEFRGTGTIEPVIAGTAHKVASPAGTGLGCGATSLASPTGFGASCEQEFEGSVSRSY